MSPGGLYVLKAQSSRGVFMKILSAENDSRGRGASSRAVKEAPAGQIWTNKQMPIS